MLGVKFICLHDITFSILDLTFKSYVSHSLVGTGWVWVSISERDSAFPLSPARILPDLFSTVRGKRGFVGTTLITFQLCSKPAPLWGGVGRCGSTAGEETVTRTPK